jgi:hypothetical protein
MSDAGSYIDHVVSVVGWNLDQEVCVWGVAVGVILASVISTRSAYSYIPLDPRRSLFGVRLVSFMCASQTDFLQTSLTSYLV